jgi:hypothetical protein
MSRFENINWRRPYALRLRPRRRFWRTLARALARLLGLSRAKRLEPEKWCAPVIQIAPYLERSLTLGCRGKGGA